MNNFIQSIKNAAGYIDETEIKKIDKIKEAQVNIKIM